MLLNDKIIIYQTADWQTSIHVKLGNEPVWLSANQMAILFDKNVKTISKHINNVFSENELGEENNTHYLSVDVVNCQKAMQSIKAWQNNTIRN